MSLSKEEKQRIENFLCACDCKIAIKDTIMEYEIPINEYENILVEIKKWIEFLLED